MARIRTIKPEFFTSPDTAKASVDARLLYIALWCWADDYGIGETNFNAILGFAFPEDDQRERKEIQSLCKEVASAFGTVFYTVRGRHFYAIPSWDDHQKTQRRATRRNPAPDDPDATPDLRIHGKRGASESTQGGSERPQGNPPAGTGEQGNRGTGEQGNPAHLGTEPHHAHASDEPDDPPAPIPAPRTRHESGAIAVGSKWNRTATTPEAAALVLAYEREHGRFTHTLRAEVGQAVDDCLRADTPPAQITAGLRAWDTSETRAARFIPEYVRKAGRTPDIAHMAKSDVWGATSAHLRTTTGDTFDAEILELEP